ncbi:MAG: helix-turn-helix transcriptional regulator [Solibacillus sp.]
MNLQQLLISLRKEETIPQAAKRMGISANYYRYLEAGIDPYRNAPVKPSPTVLQKIAKAYKVDYLFIAKAAGIEVEAETMEIPFENNPVLHQWYLSLPAEDPQQVERLFEMWNLLKGGK